jgi:hypothetical protein
MGNICEHEFNQEDNEHKGYSLIEYDLYANTGLSIRKNLVEGKYELFKILTGELVYSFNTLQEAVDRANELEGGKHTEIKCGWCCPERNVSFKK